MSMKQALSEALPILQAVLAGEQAQVRNINGKWIDVDFLSYTSININQQMGKLRIKPEPRVSYEVIWVDTGNREVTRTTLKDAEDYVNRYSHTSNQRIVKMVEELPDEN